MKNTYYSYARTCFIFGHLFFLSLQLSAQESYYKKGRATIKNVNIVTTEGMNPHYAFAIVYKDKIQYWNPGEVDEYKKTYSNVFISHEIEPGHFVFLERIESGALTLYYMRDRQFQQRFFLETSDGSFVEMTNDKRKPSYYLKVLKNEWSSCDNLKRNIDQTSYSKASVLRIIRMHNTCQIINEPSMKHYLGLGVGYSNYIVANSRNARSAVPIGGLRQGSYPRRLSYYMRYTFELPIQSSNTSLISGLRLHRLDMDYTTILGVGDINFNIDAHTIDLSLPIGILQNFTILSVRSFFTFELVPSYHILDDVTVTFNVLEPGGERKSTTSDFSTAKFATNATAALGAKLQLENDAEIMAKLGYDLRLGTGNRRLFNVTSFFFQIAYGF